MFFISNFNEAIARTIGSLSLDDHSSFITNSNFSFLLDAGPLSIGGGYHEHEEVDEEDDDDDENAIIDVEDYKMPPITITSPVPSSHHSGNNGTNKGSNHIASSTSIITTKNRIGRPTKSSLSSPVSSSTASDDERLSPDSVKVSHRCSRVCLCMIVALETSITRFVFTLRFSDNNNYTIPTLELRLSYLFDSFILQQESIKFISLLYELNPNQEA